VVLISQLLAECLVVVDFCAGKILALRLEIDTE